MLDIVDPTTYYYILEMFNDISLKDLNTNTEIFVFVSPFIKTALKYYDTDGLYLKNTITFIEDNGREKLNYGFEYIGKDDQINDYNNFFEI